MTAIPTLHDGSSTPRSRLTRLGDRALGRLLGLAPATANYSVRHGISVPMRDGVVLRADHYVPDTSEPAGTLLVRCPYGRGAPLSWLYARLYAQHGYHVVFQSARGTFGSGGVFEPGLCEIDDGADTVAWLRRQPWFTGSFATVGQSYLGFTQWALLVDPPPELAAAVITVGPHDGSAFAWGPGGLKLNDVLWWCDLAAHQEDGGLTPFIQPWRANRRLRSAMAGLPLGQTGRRLLADGSPWYETWLQHADRAAPYWQPAQLHVALDRVEIPVLLISGWQDVFLGQTLEQYRRLRGRGVDAALTVGPWMHLDLMGPAAGTVAKDSLHWLAQHLPPSVQQRRSSPVRIFVTGGAGWRELPDWPPASTDKVLYLNAGSTLTEQPPAPNVPPSRFTYDPANPTPTIGGPFLSITAGYRNDTRLAKRADVVSFTTAPLIHDLEVIGTPSVKLAHSTNNPHTDVFVRLSEVNSKGRSRNVTEGYIRLKADSRSPLQLHLDAIAHCFRAGSRIRLIIAGGSHPRYARNLGTGEPALTGTSLRPSTHLIAHGDGGISQLQLPIAH